MKRKTKNSKDRLRVWIASIVVSLVVATFLLYSVTVIKNGQTIVGIGSMVILIIIIILAIFLIRRKYSSIKQGFPYEDERSKRITVLAGYYAFLISIYFLLFLAWASDEGALIQFRDVSQALGTGILGMAIIFGLSWLIISRKSNL